MSIEEKAKAYDEALKWMRELYPGLHGATKEDAEHYFPELRDSEDEIHRKWILEYLYDGLRKADEQFKDHFKSAIDWLERKKTPSVSLNPALGFDPGSAVVYHNDESKEETTRKELLDFVRSFWADHKEKLPQASRWVTYLEKQQEIPMPNSTELVEMWEDVEATLKEHENDPYWGTWRIAYNAFLEGFGKGFMVKRDYLEKQKEQESLTFNEHYNPDDYGVVMEGNATNLIRKEQKSIEDVVKDITKNKESAIKFLKSAGIMDDNGELAEMYRSEQKPAEWSEEEIGHIYTLASYIKSKGYEDDGEFLEGVANKLKSIRSQPQWKPSEEQMEALESAVKLYKDTHFEIFHERIVSLYEQLKKL